jgi:hypothetical protein
MTMTLNVALAQLEALGHEKIRAMNKKTAQGTISSAYAWGTSARLPRRSKATTSWPPHFGRHFPEHRQRALNIGERLGIYRDYPVSKGCTSPFAPIWINEMVRRQS